MRRRASVPIVLAIATLACGPGQNTVPERESTGVESQAASAGTSSAAAGMSVAGNQLLRDGEPFRVRGFNMIGALTPAWCSQGSSETARSHFGSEELTTAIDAWHATTVRLQVSQRGLEDPSLTSDEITAYLQEIESDVSLARSLGLVVILSMQDQSIGCGPVHPLPSAQTVAAWKTLTPAFANSPYVMFELFNEPQNDVTDADWAQWRNGGAGPTSNLGDAAVGFQTLVDDIRGWGAANVLIADGARHAEHLDNITSYLLSDSSPGLGIAYAIHPYYYTPGATYWASSYGYLTGSHAIVATEWNYKASDCGTSAETLAPTFLTWLEQHGIGVTGHAFDSIGTLVADWNWTPTACGTASGGSGQVLQNWYAHLAQAPATPAGLKVTGTGATLVASWSASTGAFGIAGYDVYLDGNRASTTTTLTATLGGLSCGAAHTVGVDAVDAMGNHSVIANRSASTAACLTIASASASPQPLATSTTIAFTLSESAAVSIEIETTSGTIVKHKTTNQTMPAGANAVSYYGYDDGNGKLASGTYLVVITATDGAGQSARAQITLKIA